MTLTEIYGCDIGEYCERLGTTPDRLLKEKQAEIEMLEENYKRLLEHREKSMDVAMECALIRNVIDSKKEKMKRIEKWCDNEDVVWKAGWYATRLHAISKHKIETSSHDRCMSLCGSYVYTVPQTPRAARLIQRGGIPKCAHCLRLLGKKEKMKRIEKWCDDG